MILSVQQLIRQSFFSFLGILAAFFMLSSGFLAYHTYQIFHEQLEVSVQHDIDMIDSLIIEPLNKGDYITVAQFVSRWGEEYPNVVSMELRSKSDFVIAGYTRERAASIPNKLSRVVEYGDNRQATLHLVYDEEKVHQDFNEFAAYLSIISLIGVSLLGLILWNTMKRSALHPLELEIETRKKAEQASVIAKEEAEHASLAKSEFLSRMSHELRTPMNAILGFSQLLRIDDKLNDEQKESVEEIMNAGNHLLDLINDVLDIAKIESDNISLTITSVKLEEIIEASIKISEFQAEKRGVKIIYEIGDCRGSAVLADFIRLKQVLLNLLSNAVKYNKDGGTVTLCCQKADERVVLSVTDTGIGLSDKQQEALFQPFNRLGAEISGVEGTGIGLVITKRLVEMMNGTITVESHKGEGSKFSIEIPLVKPYVNTETIGYAQSVPIPDKYNKCVICIVDNPTNIRLIKQLLSKISNCKLITCDSPKIGVEEVFRAKPDLILLDVNLPEMDGFEILRQIQSNPETETIPVIGISADASPVVIDKAISAGFEHYLTLPFDVDHLHDTVKKCIMHT